MRLHIGQPAVVTAQRWSLSEPRIALGIALCQANLASASADVSDGLLADIGHIANTSGLAAIVRTHDVPLSKAGSAAVASDDAWLNRLLSGGDDYEIVFTASPSDADHIRAAGAATDTPVQRIGVMAGGSGVSAVDADGLTIAIDNHGYRHI